jgi:hypothetical protein
VTRPLLLGGETDVVPTAGRYPAEDGETRILAPAGLCAATAETRAADSERVGGASTDCQQENSREASEKNSAHTQ